MKRDTQDEAARLRALRGVVDGALNEDSADRAAEHERAWRRLVATRERRAASKWRWLLVVPAAGAVAVGALLFSVPRGDLTVRFSGGMMDEQGFVVPNGPHSVELLLSDGTEIDLGAGARARLSSRTRREPRIELLAGDLIAHIPTERPAPWIIDVAGVEIATSGARLNIARSADSDDLRITLTEGHAKVQRHRSPPQRDQFETLAVLGAGQTLDLDLGRILGGTKRAAIVGGFASETGTITTKRDVSEEKRAALASSGVSSACPTRPMNPADLTALGPSDWSHWIQPWRGWQETIPADRFLDGLGLTLGDTRPSDHEMDLMAAAGIRHVTVELGWNHLDVADLTQFRPGFAAPRIELLQKLSKRGIRPTILLNAFGGPPARTALLELTAPAARGAREIQVNAASVARIEAGQTRLDWPHDVFITEVSAAGRAQLSQPLTTDIPAGPHRATVPVYAPFRRPTLANGETDNQFQETLAGWQNYVRAAIALAKAATGGGFDVEIWNIAISARDLFDVERFFDPLPSDLGVGGSESAVSAMIQSVVTVVRDPGNGLQGVRIANGFSNRRWTESALTQLPGIDALGRHVSIGPMQFPESARTVSRRALDGRGMPNGNRGLGGDGWRETFTPSYVAFFPERPLSGLGEDPLWRDLAPQRTTDGYGVVHGRSAESPVVWLNSVSMGLGRRRLELNLSQQDVWHTKARFALRSAIAFLGKGASRVTFYNHDGQETLIDPSDSALGGLPFAALGRLNAALKGARPIGRPRAIELSVLSCPDGEEFSGLDKTHPPLRHADLLTFVPLQIDDNRMAIALYVMTRDLLRNRGGIGPTRMDLPAQSFRLRIKGLPSTRGQPLVLIDPMTAGPLPADAVKLVSEDAEGLVVDVAVTDSPRLLRVGTP